MVRSLSLAQARSSRDIRGPPEPLSRIRRDAWRHGEPGAPGLGTTTAVLALAHAGSGFGISTLIANLTLAIPAEAAAGTYTGSLSVSAVTALP